MIPPLGVNSEVRDIVFRDSCNCCFPRRANPATRVYVNSMGHVVEFDKTKTTNESEAIVRSIEHLSQIVNRMIEDREIDKQDIIKDVSEKIHQLQENCHVPLTREMVEDIVYQVQTSPKRRK